MEDILLNDVSRVEANLNTLIDSITYYNPSTQAATDLVAADDSLSRSLERLAVHQANHTRIQELKQTEAALDNQIKSTIALLGETRKELLDTPATTFPPASRDVPFNELLAYAKRISKYTVPPTFRPPPPVGTAQPEQIHHPDTKTSNGIATSPTAGGADGIQPPQKDEGRGMAALSEDQKRWLDHFANLPFVPWPADDVIRRGGLAQIQLMLEQGKDPATVPSLAEQEAQDRRRAEEDERDEKEKEEREEQARKRREGGYASQQPRQQEAPETSFDLYDPEADED